MEPLIPKDCQVTFDLKEEYLDGDIIGVIKNGETGFIIRKYYKKDDLIILSALNPEFQPIACSKSDIKFLGKVNQVIIKL